MAEDYSQEATRRMPPLAFPKLLVRVPLLCVLLVGMTTQVRAQHRGPHVLRIEGGAAMSLRVQDERDDLGGGFGVGYEYRLGGPIGLTAKFAGYYFPYDETDFRGEGVAAYHGLGPGIRLHVLSSESSVDIWVGAGAQLVLTGDLTRPGFDGGVGVDFGLGDGSLALGPFVRYAQVLQPEDDVLGGADGRLLQFGAALSWGHVDPPPVEAVEQPPPARVPAPAPVPADTDGDGIEDMGDSCPSEPEDIDTFEDGDGCPDPDNDSDGVADAEDACPLRPGVATSNGCPAPPPVAQAVEEVEPVEPLPKTRTVTLPTRVIFAIGATKVTAASARKLQAVLAIMRAEAGIRRVRVTGHADGQGPDGNNQALSEERAKAVVAWLVGHGIKAERLETRGMGSTQARAAGDSEEAYRKNRRVEFEIIDPIGGKLPVAGQDQ